MLTESDLAAIERLIEATDKVGGTYLISAKVPALVAALRAAWRERDIALGEILVAESDRNTWTIKWESAEEAYQEAAAERDRYRTALEHYADQRHWARYRNDREWDFYTTLGNGFDVARAALAAPGAGGQATEEQG